MMADKGKWTESAGFNWIPPTVGMNSSCSFQLIPLFDQSAPPVHSSRSTHCPTFVGFLNCELFELSPALFASAAAFGVLVFSEAISSSRFATSCFFNAEVRFG